MFQVELDSKSFKLRKEWWNYPTKYRERGHLLLTPHCEIHVADYGLVAELTLYSRITQPDELDEAFKAIEELVKWCRDKRLIRYDLHQKIKTRGKRLAQLLGRESATITTSPVFITYPIPPTIVTMVGATKMISQRRKGVILSENEWARFGTRAYVRQPAPPVRHEGRVTVIGEKGPVERTFKELKKEAELHRVYTD